MIFLYFVSIRLLQYASPHFNTFVESDYRFTHFYRNASLFLTDAIICQKKDVYLVCVSYRALFFFAIFCLFVFFARGHVDVLHFMLCFARHPLKKILSLRFHSSSECNMYLSKNYSFALAHGKLMNSHNKQINFSSTSPSLPVFVPFVPKFSMKWLLTIQLLMLTVLHLSLHFVPKIILFYVPPCEDNLQISSMSLVICV